MKKIVGISILSMFLFSNNTFAYSKADLDSANYLGYKGFIVMQENQDNYNLDKEISRREMLKVMVMISGTRLSNACSGKFSDILKTDWACKYAEIALRENFIASNDKFNPGDNISKIEALKMIMQAVKVEKKDNADWRAGYIEAAIEKGIISKGFTDYDTKATRGWIFSMAKNAYMSVTDEELDMINFFLK